MKKRYLFLNNPIFLEWNIKQLPPNLRNYLYIWCIKLFWRRYVPLTAKIPSWYSSYVKQQNDLLQARLQNIHFLHLPCNTLEENKKYIIGCQCSYCKDCGIDIILQYKEENFSSILDFFHKCVYYTDSSWNNFNEYIHYNIDNLDDPDDLYDEYFYKKGMKIFDPGYDIYINLNDIITGPPIKFNEIDYS